MATMSWRSLRAVLAPLRGSARFAVFGLAAITIAGCEDRTPPFATRPEPLAGAVETWTDPETGCRYLLISEDYPNLSRAAITPRLRVDGTPDCSTAHLTASVTERKR